MATIEKTGKKATRQARRAAEVDKLKDMDLLGEIITWNASPPGAVRTHNYTDVVKALEDCGLNKDHARELLPRHAFGRAARQLKEERVIDVSKETEGVIVFQFTKKQLSKDEWQFQKETFLELDKDTGQVACPNKGLEEKAQALVDEAMRTRTTNDITKIVQRLFEENSDLLPIRDQGGVYFVPQVYTEFTLKISEFLSKLGGRIDRFPVPAGTQHGDASIQNAVATAMDKLVQDHELAIKEFTVNTRKDTIERAAEKIKATRVKIEAYASYLADKQADLLKAVDAANDHLREQIAKLSQLKEERTSDGEGTVRQSLFGHPITAVIRWMGKNGWTYDEAAEAFARKSISVARATIVAQLAAGKKGMRGDPAPITAKQAAELKGK